MKKGKSKLLEALRAVRNELYSAVKRELADETCSYKDIADANGVSVATIQRIAQRSGISRQVGPRPRPKGAGVLRNKFAQFADAPFDEADDASASYDLTRDQPQGNIK